MHRFVLLVLLVLPLFLQRSSGQADSSSSRIFSGQVIDDSLACAIPSVHIWNESMRTGTVSNVTGAFSIMAGSRDTVVFSAIGYWSKILVLSPDINPDVVIRMRPKTYGIDEVAVRRFRSYESFLYQVAHLDLPESEIAELKTHLKVSASTAAVDVDREKAIKEKLETGRFGYITPLGKGVNQEKVFREKMLNLKKREQVIHAKFNREMVGKITQLEGDDLSDFIALCNFSEEYLYETDLVTIVEELYARLEDYRNMADTIPSVK